MFIDMPITHYNNNNIFDNKLNYQLYKQKVSIQITKRLKKQ